MATDSISFISQCSVNAEWFTSCHLQQSDICRAGMQAWLCLWQNPLLHTVAQPCWPKLVILALHFQVRSSSLELEPDYSVFLHCLSVFIYLAIRIWAYGAVVTRDNRTVTATWINTCHLIKWITSMTSSPFCVSLSIKAHTRDYLEFGVLEILMSPHCCG